MCDEEALAAEHRLLQALEHAASRLGLHLDGGRHADHRSRFGPDGLAGFELDDPEGERWAVLNFVTHRILSPARPAHASESRCRARSSAAEKNGL